MIRGLLLILSAMVLATARGASAQQVLGTPTQKMRVAVMDLSGSALKMQSTTTMMPGGGQPGMPPQQYGQRAIKEATSCG